MESNLDNNQQTVRLLQLLDVLQQFQGLDLSFQVVRVQVDQNDVQLELHQNLALLVLRVDPLQQDAQTTADIVDYQGLLVSHIALTNLNGGGNGSLIQPLIDHDGLTLQNQFIYILKKRDQTLNILY